MNRTDFDVRRKNGQLIKFDVAEITKDGEKYHLMQTDGSKGLDYNRYNYGNAVGERRLMRTCFTRFESWHDWVSYLENQFGAIQRGEHNSEYPGRASQIEHWKKIVKGRAEKTTPCDCLESCLDPNECVPVGYHHEQNRFHTSQSWEEYMHKNRYGNPDVAPLVGKHALEIESVAGVLVPVKEARLSVCGNEVLIDRYKMGDPECTFVIEDSEYLQASSYGKVVELACTMQFHHGVNTNAPMYRGAAIIALVDALQNFGFSVGLTVYSHVVSSADRETMGMSIRLKDQNQPLDADAVGMALCDADTFRRGVFFLYEENQRVNGHQSGEWSGWSNIRSIASARYSYRSVAKGGPGLAQGREGPDPDSHIIFDRVMLTKDGNMLECAPCEPFSQANLPDVENWQQQFKEGSRLWDMDQDQIVKANAGWLVKQLQHFGVTVEGGSTVAT